jgi:hypothetical protein
MYARAACDPVSSLFHSANRIVRSVFTSGELKTRASSITSAVPDPSSFAASPQPWPSMWPPTMYISSGCVVPTLVQKTISRGPGVVGCMLSARNFSSGCFIGSVFTPVGILSPRGRPPPTARPVLGRPRPPAAAGGGSYTYVMRSVGQP